MPSRVESFNDQLDEGKVLCRVDRPTEIAESVVAADGTQTKTYTWVSRYVASDLVLLAGLIVMTVGLAGA